MNATTAKALLLCGLGAVRLCFVVNFAAVHWAPRQYRMAKDCPECRTACRDDATRCDACGRDFRTVPASQSSQGKAWAIAGIVLVIGIVGVVWFFAGR
jgi:hypothetical protein